jgi:hypothetical protein
MTSKFYCCLLVVLVGTGCATTPAEKLPTAYCPYVDRRIHVDGRLDEPEWARTPELVLSLTDSGKAPTLPTTARMLWNDSFLYVGFACRDKNVQANMTHTDDELWREEEVVEVFICPHPEGVEYYEFQVNPQNARIDLSCVASSPKGESKRCTKEWNCVGWFSSVQVDGTLNNVYDEDRGWSCEMAIPLSSISPKDPPVRHGDTWRINLYRINRIEGGVEYSAWSPTGAINYHIPGKFGICQFVRDGATASP